MSDQTLTSSEPITSDSKTIIQAFIDMLPLSLAVVPWGVLCGSLAINVGLTPLQAQLMSLFIFAGAAQLAALTIMGNLGSLSSLYSSTLVISSRHLLYSAVFRNHMRKSSFGLRCCMAFFLTDEMFAVTCADIAKNKRFNPVYALSAGISFYLAWNVATFAGILAGQYIPSLEHLGLEFAIAATFIAIVIPTIKRKSTLVSVVTSGLSAIILSVYLTDYALIGATFIGMVCGYFTQDKESTHE